MLQRAYGIFANDSEGCLAGRVGRVHRYGTINIALCGRASGMLNGGETTGADVLVASLGADSRLLEPLCATHVRGLQCFLDECCAPARAAHAFAHICGAGSYRSRARGPETCVSCANAAPSCIMAHFGLPRCVIREHEHCSTHPEACLDCQCHICAI